MGIIDIRPDPIRLPAGQATAMYRTMALIRRFEQLAVQLYRQGLIRGYFHPYTGEEAIATGVCAALDDGDAIVSTHRGHGHCIARGLDLPRMTAELLGREAGYCRGRGGSMHIADLARGVLGANGIVGGGLPIAVGAAKGFRLQGRNAVAACFFGDGASNNGTCAESLNLAAIWNLPVLFVLENNQYAVSTPIAASSRSATQAERARGYGIAAETINGNDVELVYARAREAVDRCRRQQGPFFLECLTYRHGGHHVNDPGAYMPAEELAFWKEENDPLANWRRKLLAGALAGEDELAAIDRAVEAVLAEAIAFARDAAEPSVEEFIREIGGAPCRA